ncbi:MAG: ComEC/Rec2 family competence protein, partial [Lachnospiraceae bacterium]|nr:ComEC/Rec2 family competence protein [Lachnospiraceae bacterium]
RPHQRAVSALLWGLFLQMATLPLVAYYYYSVSVYGVLLNILLLPFLGVLLSLGLIGGFLGCVWLPVGACLLNPCHYIFYYYEKMASFFVSLPGAEWIIGKPHIFQIMIYYTGLFLVVLRLEQWGLEEYEKHQLAIERVSGRFLHQSQSFGEGRMRVFVSLACVILLFGLQWRPIQEFEVVMLSVGQGDGLFVDSGMGKRFLIDGGSTSTTELGKYTLLPFLKSRGIASIDIWFLTHMDEDHISGFIDLAAGGYPIKTLVLARAVEQTGKYDQILELCRRRHITVRYMTTKDRIAVQGGLVQKKEVSFECLGPDWPSLFSGANENSLVLGLRYQGFEAIFTGDIGTEQEDAMLAEKRLSEFARDGRVELLKAAHHGSNGSNGTEWLSVVDPVLIVISAGKNNRYHHPGKEAVERMDGLKLKHLCTIECGQISVRWKDGKMWVERYKAEKK